MPDPLPHPPWLPPAQAGVRTNEEREQTLNQLLSEMDGFTPDSGVVFVAATNRADLLDPALMRAGRFDRKITILRPDEQGRNQILQVGCRAAGGPWGGPGWGGAGAGGRRSRLAGTPRAGAGARAAAAGCVALRSCSAAAVEGPSSAPGPLGWRRPPTHPPLNPPQAHPQPRPRPRCPRPAKQIHARRFTLGPDVDLQQLAKDLPGLSGAHAGGAVADRPPPHTHACTRARRRLCAAWLLPVPAWATPTPPLRCRLPLLRSLAQRFPSCPLSPPHT